MSNRFSGDPNYGGTATEGQTLRNDVPSIQFNPL